MAVTQGGAMVALSVVVEVGCEEEETESSSVPATGWGEPASALDGEKVTGTSTYSPGRISQETGGPALNGPSGGATSKTETKHGSVPPSVRLRTRTLRLV